MNNSNYEGFTDIFPTRIHKFKIDQNLIDKSLAGINTKSSGFNYTNVLNNPNFLNLQEQVLNSAQSIFPDIKDVEKWKIVTSWLNNQAPNEKGFDFHNHIDSFISSVLYLKRSDMSLSFRDDPKEAQGYTSSANFDIIIRHNWNVDVNIPISVGDLLFFPSYLLHKPNINQTNLNRISFACNLMPSILQRPHSQPWSMDLKL